jgi:hypothetical protein
MLATPAKTTPMLATNNYYQARLDFVEAKKKPAPNAEANEAGRGPKAAGIMSAQAHSRAPRAKQTQLEDRQRTLGHSHW